MIPHGAAIIADENVHAGVVAWLRAGGFDVVTVRERGCAGCSDEAVLAIAIAEERVILTHDGDFGEIAVGSPHSDIAIIRVRPGHHDAAFTIGVLAAAFRLEPQSRPFIAVLSRQGDMVQARVRKLA